MITILSRSAPEKLCGNSSNIRVAFDPIAPLVCDCRTFSFRTHINCRFKAVSSHFIVFTKFNKYRGVAQFGGNNRDRCRWQVKGAIVGAAVEICPRPKRNTNFGHRKLVAAERSASVGFISFS